MTYLVLQQLDNVSHFQSGSTCWSHGVSLIWGHWQHLWFFFCKIPLLLFCLCLRGWLYPSCFQFVAQKKKKDFCLSLSCHSAFSSLTCWFHGVLHQNPFCNLFTHLANTKHTMSAVIGHFKFAFVISGGLFVEPCRGTTVITGTKSRVLYTTNWWKSP